jgi:hypothetical protein
MSTYIFPQHNQTIVRLIPGKTLNHNETLIGWEDPGRIIMNHNQTLFDQGRIIMNHNQTFFDSGRIVTNHNQTLFDSGRIIMNHNQSLVRR